MQPLSPAEPPAPSATSIGHVHLRVADLDRSMAFYSGVLGLDVMQKFGEEAALLSAGGYHDHLGLNNWESKRGTPPPAWHNGLYHTAFLYPSRAALGAAVKRVVEAGYKVTSRADHGVSEAVYLNDPDGNGVELYRDRPRAEWPMGTNGKLAMVNAALEVGALIAEAEAA